MTGKLDQRGPTTARCPACVGGGLVPALGRNCEGNAHTCLPMICGACANTGQAQEATARDEASRSAVQLAPRAVAVTRGEAASQVTPHRDADRSNSQADSTNSRWPL